MDPIFHACFVRDRFRCRHCNNSNNLHPHHIVYRSHGGKDELNNLVTLCSFCHLEGVHKKKLILEVLQVLENDVIVRFTRVGKWKPC